MLGDQPYKYGIIVRRFGVYQVTQSPKRWMVIVIRTLQVVREGIITKATYN